MTSGVDAKQINPFFVSVLCVIFWDVCMVTLFHLDSAYFCRLPLLEFHNLAVVDAINLAPFNFTSR